MKHFQKRDKFFYLIPKFYPDWPYPSRYAIGMKLDDFYWRGCKYFKFEVKGVKYQIEREKAIKLGNKYMFKSGKLPNLIPKEEFEIV